MALGLVEGGISILVVLSLSAFGYFLYTKTREKEEPENKPIFENYMPQYSEGHTDGIVDDIIIGEKRIGIVFLPRDINYIKLLKNKLTSHKIKNKYIIFYDKRQVDFFPQGGFSGHRDKIKAYPSNVDMIPDSIKNTDFGKKVMEFIEKNNELKDQNELAEQRMESLKRFSKKTYGGEIYEEFGTSMSKILEDAKTTLNKPEEKKDEKK